MFWLITAKNRLELILITCALSCSIYISGSMVANARPYEIAVLQALDKVTARVFTLKAITGTVESFGELQVVVRHCDKRPPEEPPETAAFLEISVVRDGKAKVNLFSGWMFASFRHQSIAFFGKSSSNFFRENRSSSTADTT